MPSFFHTEAEIKKKREENELKSLKLPSVKPKFLEICLNLPPKKF